MTPRLPISTLLSQVLVAFTIEFDNEFERQMPHRTTAGTLGDTCRGPWLVSLAMWANFMRFIPRDGVPLREVEDLASMTNLAGLERWGYIALAPNPADARPGPPRRAWLVRPTPEGRQAQSVWRPLAGTIERRWRDRFGRDEVDELRAALCAIVEQLDSELPHYLPVVRHAMFSVVPSRESLAAGRDGALDSELDLSVLLSQVLLAFTIDFERATPVSLPMSANVLRLLDDTGLRVRDLPRRSGVSKEAISMMIGFLEKHDYVVVEPDPANTRTKLARLTPDGFRAQATYHALPSSVETRWQEQFGADTVRTLRASLSRFVGDSTVAGSPLRAALAPPLDGWRASTPLPETLPHYPMVLHRGGFPDGR